MYCSPEIWFSHRVSYGETDKMGYLYYGEYLHIFERGRNEFIRKLGMSYAKIEANGLRLPVCNASCRYRRPAHYDELLNLSIRIIEIKKVSLTFTYAVMDEHHSHLIAEGSTKHACTNIHGQLIKAPHWFIKFLQENTTY